MKNFGSIILQKPSINIFKSKLVVSPPLKGEGTADCSSAVPDCYH
jgi:hypothetical protein